MPNFLYSTAMEPGNSIYVDRITALTRSLGPTVIYEDEGSPFQRRSVLGYVSDDYSSNPDYANYGRYAEIGFYELGWTTQAWVYDGSSTQVYRDSQYGTHGSFLVRDAVATQVPEPKTLALSAAALLALFTVRRKKKSIS